MQEINGVKVWGDPVDEGAMRQIQNCARLGAAEVALMADHHKGYAVPIGGVVAYENQISPSGVGFDIACLAEGSQVTTADGYTLPIEKVTDATRLGCFDGQQVRAVSAHDGVTFNGIKAVRKLVLQNGRTVTLTPDHRVQTACGWKAAADIVAGDLVACPVFRGLPYEPVDFARLEVEGIAADVIALLRNAADRGTLAPLVRLLGVVSGDGHVTLDGKRISVYTTSEADAEAIALDWMRLGASPCFGRRNRKAGYKTEIHVYVNSTTLHQVFRFLGLPVGRKPWPADPMPWLSRCPGWVQAQFVSGFVSAECTTPRASAKNLPNLAIKRSGENPNAIEFIAHLLKSLSFDVSVAPTGPACGARRDWVLHILGGLDAQVRFAETVGFCHAEAKRVASAEVASRVWQHQVKHQVIIARRVGAQQEARARHGASEHWKSVQASVAAKWGVSEGFVYHAIYDDREMPRCASVALPSPQTTHAACWVPVAECDDLPHPVPVYDIPTRDDAHSFIAEGIAVHNCGNKAVLLDIPAVEVRKKIKKVMDAVWEGLSFGMGRNNKEEVDHELFDDPAWSLLTTSEKQIARNQLGTIGGGNHYVDLFADEQDRVWVGVHFGSRGLGHKIATHYLALGGAKDGMDADPLVLDADSDLGEQYLTCMNLAGRYAYAGRDWVCGKVARILKAKIVEEVHNHHNFAWKESHEGRDLYVVRKGATPAFPGQKGFVGGSMGDISVIIEGVDSEESKDALYSTVHGAGRVMSRTAAKGKVKRNGEVIKPGAVTRRMMEAWVIRDKNVELRGGGVDESPHVYKRLPEVLEHHKNTIRILHTLTPLGVAMAGENEHDPYKD